MKIPRASRSRRRHHAGQPWDEEETAVLLELYPNHAVVDIAVRLGRSEWAVIGKARGLGLTKRHPRRAGQPTASGSRRWSPAETETLRKLCSSLPYEEIGEILGRSRNAVHMKARKLGLRKMDFWTIDEDALLRKDQMRCEYSQVARNLKRTLSSVKARVITLELERKVDVWTEGEMRSLACNYSEARAADIAKSIGRTEAATAQKALRAGIVKKPRWSMTEIKRLYELFPQRESREIARLIGRSHQAVRGKLRQLGLTR
jgi:hypothetical protein